MVTSIVSRVAVVTGCSGLLGAQVCSELLADGVQVVGVDIVARPATDFPFIQADVGDPTALGRAAERVGQAVPTVDWLIHAAAITGRTPGMDTRGNLRSIDLTIWDQLVRINLSSALFCVRAFAPLMARSDDAKIVLLGSIQGLVPTLDSGAYAVAKAGLVGLLRQLAAEMAPDDITVNMVSPGPIANREPAEIAREPQPGPTPMGRYGEPAEVAAAVRMVLHHGPRFMTGAQIPVDGGEHLRPRASPRRPESGSSDLSVQPDRKLTR